MGRIGRVLAVLAFAWSVLVIAPAAESVASPEPSAVVVQAQDAPPGPDLRQDSGQQMDRQRVTAGTAGIVLIALVLISRKQRKKPVLFVEWKRKG